MKFLCMFLWKIISLIVISITETDSTDLSPSVSYVLVEDVMNWPNARDYCISINGNLMEPRTQTEMDAAIAIYTHLGQGFYLGGSDILQEGQWIWNSDGSDIDMTRFWKSDQPSNGTLENYMVMCSVEGLCDAVGDRERPFACTVVL